MAGASAMSSTPQAAQPPRPGARLLAAAALLPALTVAWQSWHLMQQDLAFTAAETEVSFWGRAGYLPSPATRQRTERTMETLLAASPAQPDYLELAASLYSWQGYWSANAAQAGEYDRRALQAQYAAQLSRPAYRPGWEGLVEQAIRIGDRAMSELAGARLAALRTGQAANDAAADVTADTRENTAR